MKRSTLLLLAAVASASTLTYAEYRGDTNHDGKLTMADVAALVEGLKTPATLTAVADVNGDGIFNSADVTALTDIILGKAQPTDIDASDFSGIITVTYNGTTATVSGGLPSYITATVNGADVVITNTNTTDEITTVLKGTSTSGSFVYNGEYKTTVVLDGLTLKGSSEEAVNIKCGKRVALLLAEGTVNSLEDATTDGGQKAALHTKGHLEISGAGTLNLKGNVKHALSSKEYLQLKKTVGTINITSAASDGIHAGQYYQQNGGIVTIEKVGGDGIQAELTDTPDDEQNGQMIIKGGSLNITTTGNDVAALKSDALMTIEGGTFTLTTSGAGDKALKSKGTVSVTGGDFTIKQSGKPYIEDGNLGYVSAVKAAELIDIAGGTWNITNSVIGGRGFSSDADVSISGTAHVTMNISGNGGTAADAVEGVADSGNNTGTEEQKSYRVYVNLPTSTSGGGGRPGQTSSNAWSAVALYSSDGTLVSNVSTTLTVNGTQFYYYDFKQSTSGTYYFGNPNGYSSGGWSSTTYTIKTSTFSGPTDGKDHYYKAATSYSTSGTTRTYSLSDVTSQYEGGTIGGGTTTGDGFTAKGIKADRNVTLLGGTINIAMTGTGAKGIKVDGTYTQGNDDGTGPVLTVSTTGASYGSSGSTGGWGGPGGGMGGSTGSSSKGIKVQGTIRILGGESVVTTATNGAEGLESKTAALGAIVVSGGKHYFKCYDDCINSAGGIDFNGGTVVCYGFGNDAIDSNYGRSGAIRIGDGNVLTYTTKGSPEEGLDCDNNSYIQITGNGNVVALGGAQGGGSSSGIGSSVQGYVLSTSSLSIQSGRYYTLADASGNNLFTFSTEASVSSTMSLISAKGMKSGSSYTLKYSTTAPTDATTAWHGFYLGSTAVGTTSLTTLTAK